MHTGMLVVCLLIFAGGAGIRMTRVFTGFAASGKGSQTHSAALCCTAITHAAHKKAVIVLTHSPQEGALPQAGFIQQASGSPCHVDVIILEALEVDDQRLWQLLDARAPERSRLAAQVLTEPRVLTLHQLTLGQAHTEDVRQAIRYSCTLLYMARNMNKETHMRRQMQYPQYRPWRLCCAKECIR